MHFTELDLELSRRRYDQFITACSGLGIQTTPLIIQLHLFVLCQVYNVLGKSTIDNGGLALYLSMVTLIIVGW